MFEAYLNGDEQAKISNELLRVLWRHLVPRSGLAADAALAKFRWLLIESGLMCRLSGDNDDDAVFLVPSMLPDGVAESADAPFGANTARMVFKANRLVPPSLVPRLMATLLKDEGAKYDTTNVSRDDFVMVVLKSVALRVTRNGEQLAVMTSHKDKAPLCLSLLQRALQQVVDKYLKGLTLAPRAICTECLRDIELVAAESMCSNCFKTQLASVWLSSSTTVTPIEAKVGDVVCVSRVVY